MTYITKQKVKLWAVSAFVRAAKTAAQTALAMIPVGVTISEVGWPAVAGTAALSAVLSMLTSVAGLPEVADGADLPTILAGGGNHAA